ERFGGRGIKRVQPGDDLLREFSRGLAHSGKRYFCIAEELERLRFVQPLGDIVKSIDDPWFQLLVATASKGQQPVEGSFGISFAQRAILPEVHILRFDRDAGSVADESVIAAELGPCCVNRRWIFS